MNKKNTKRAEQLMRDYVQTLENKKALQATIANEVKAYDENLKAFGEELLAIGEEHKTEFDGDGNMHFADGYLHIVENTIVVTGKKFDPSEFNKAYPELIDVDFNVGLVKKAFLDVDLRKQLKALGVSVDTEKSMKIIANKK